MLDYATIPIEAIIPTAISITALVISIYSTSKNAQILIYSSIDKMYTELMKVGVDNPDFRDLKRTTDYKNSFNGDRLFAYESYAFMSINMIATVYDKYKKIPRTWLNIITLEANLHKSWLNDNHSKFRSEFIDFIEHNTVNNEQEV